MVQMIRNILMDLDDTILDFHQAERCALEKTLVYLGIDPAPETMARYSQINLAQWKLLEQGKLTRDQVKVRRYTLLFDQLGVQRCARSAAQYYEKQLAVGHFFIPGALETLKTLSARYRVYVVSNGTTAVQRPRMESAGIGRYLSGVFLSEQIGCAKPSPAFFEACFSGIEDFSRAQTVIVGDSLSADIRGGKDAGITTVWFNPGGACCPAQDAPDYQIRRLSELAPLLAGL